MHPQFRVLSMNIKARQYKARYDKKEKKSKRALVQILRANRAKAKFCEQLKTFMTIRYPFEAYGLVLLPHS